MTEQRTSTVTADISMQDVRLVAGEGKLSARQALDAVNVTLRQRAERAERGGVAQQTPKSIDDIAAEITEEIRCEERARERVAKADEVSGDIYLLKVLLSVIDSQNAALREYEAAAQQTQWQLIDTAPKFDGCYVDLWFPKMSGEYGRVPDCRWLANERLPGWYAECDEGAYYVGDHATHWMYRPESPALSSTERPSPPTECGSEG
jgi:hypothetical protein